MRAALAVAALLLAGCAAGRGVPVAVATADGAHRYAGERRLGAADAVALTASDGATCAGDLHATTETDGAPAAYGGVRCEDGRIGMLLFSGAPGAGGGAVEGVMDRRKVKGGWGSAAGAGV